MPVPSEIQTRLRFPCPAPRQRSPRTSRLASFSTRMGRPSVDSRCSFSGGPLHPRVGAPDDHTLRLGDDGWHAHHPRQHLPFQAGSRAAQVVDDLRNTLHAARARHGVGDTTVQDLTAQIGQRTDHRLGDVDADNHAGAAIQFEQGGAAATTMDAGLALAHQSPVNQLGDDTGDESASSDPSCPATSARVTGPRCRMTSRIAASLTLVPAEPTASWMAGT